MSGITNRLPSDVLGQGLRYALAGGTVALVYLLSTLVMADVVGLPFELALALGFCLALCLHFVLQRLFVWTPYDRAYKLPVQHQLGRYLLLAGAQYGITAASVGLLPAVLGLPSEAVYVATLALLTPANFLLLGRGVFHAVPPQESPTPPSRPAVR